MPFKNLIKNNPPLTAFPSKPLNYMVIPSQIPLTTRTRANAKQPVTNSAQAHENAPKRLAPTGYQRARPEYDTVYQNSCYTIAPCASSSYHHA